MKFTWEDMKNDDASTLVKYYLFSCYLYYELDRNILLDSEFEKLCKRLLLEFDNINHMHKHLLDKESLKASTGYDLKYPTIVKHCASRWYADYLRLDSMG